MHRSLILGGAVLFTVGMFTGIWSAAALSGMVEIKIPHLALAAHLNAVMGALWMFAVAYSFQHLTYNEKQLTRLAWLVMIPSWGNWSITLFASFWGVRGINYTDDMRNNIIAFLLQLFVVLPSLVASVYWVRGFVWKGAPR